MIKKYLQEKKKKKKIKEILFQCILLLPSRWSRYIVELRHILMKFNILSRLIIRMLSTFSSQYIHSSPFYSRNFSSCCSLICRWFLQTCINQSVSYYSKSSLTSFCIVLLIRIIKTINLRSVRWFRLSMLI